MTESMKSGEDVLYDARDEVAIVTEMARSALT